MRSSFFCSWDPCEKLSLKTSAPAKNNFSIISLLELAGPNVTTCFTDFLHRCATFGIAATVVSLGKVAAVMPIALFAILLLLSPFVVTVDWSEDALLDDETKAADDDDDDGANASAQGVDIAKEVRNRQATFMIEC